MSYFVYILLCDNGSFYTGYTKDVEERAKVHANGRGARYTKMHKPEKVVYTEMFEVRSEAMRREKAIKKLNHVQKQFLINSQNLSKAVLGKNINPEVQVESKVKRVPTPKLTWTQKLHDSKNLPKVAALTSNMSKQWGTGTMVIPAPVEVDEFMRKVPEGKLTTINDIRCALAKKHQATIACPMTTGIFSWIAANAAVEQQAKGEKNITPYWRTLKSGGFLNDKYPGGTDIQKQLLENEGHLVALKGKRYVVVAYEKALVDL
jgi:predicted GIY-YIG superfamily endonuclease